MKKLPKFKINVDEDEAGVSAIAFTKRPAIKVMGMAFNSHENEVKTLSFQDNLKYRIVAPALIPMDIYRLSEDGDEYEVSFTVEEIDKIHQKFMADLPTNGFFNLEHDNDQKVPAYILEAWIVENPETDKSFTKYGIEVPQGTLMLTTQITDKDFYNQLVENNQVGYSVEGMFGMELSEIKNNFNKQEEKMKQEFKLQDGSTLFINEDGTYEIKPLELADMPVEEDKPVDEVPAEEVKKEEEMAIEEPVAEETPAEDAMEPAEEEMPIESYSKEEVDSKFEELYKIIGELQAKSSEDKPVEVPVQSPVQMSIHDKFAEFVRFSKSVK